PARRDRRAAGRQPLRARRATVRLVKNGGSRAWGRLPNARRWPSSRSGRKALAQRVGRQGLAGLAAERDQGEVEEAGNVLAGVLQPVGDERLDGVALLGAV